MRKDRISQILCGLATKAGAAFLSRILALARKFLRLRDGRRVPLSTESLTLLETLPRGAVRASFRCQGLIQISEAAVLGLRQEFNVESDERAHNTHAEVMQVLSDFDAMELKSRT
jgi:hypothetical protein